jgi:hypothetical protein
MVIIDQQAPALEPDPSRVRQWLAGQRVFISSAMGDTAPERRQVAGAVGAAGATPVWFEDFGGIDADAEEAYLTEVDFSSIYLGILGEAYGRMLASGFSATETEYLRARESGKRISVWVRDNAPRRDGHLRRFIEDVRVFHTTGRYETPEDLAERVSETLRRLASIELSPWIKVDQLVFRADEIEEGGGRAIITARVAVDVQRELDRLEERRTQVQVAYQDRVIRGQISQITRQTTAVGPARTTIQLDRVQPPGRDQMRAGTSGYSADDLVEAGLRSMLFGEQLPPKLQQMGFLAEAGIDQAALQQTLGLPEAFAASITRLIIMEGLVGSGKADAVTRFTLGPRIAGRRKLELAWREPAIYVNVVPGERAIAGFTQ